MKRSGGVRTKKLACNFSDLIRMFLHCPWWWIFVAFYLFQFVFCFEFLACNFPFKPSSRPWWFLVAMAAGRKKG
jgi:hypothetical protein